MKVAVFDIGTNTVRVLSGGLVSGEFIETVRESRVVRLGQGVSATKRFHPDAVERTLQGLAELRALCGDVDRVDAVATSATRDASNRGEFLDAAAEVLGIRPRMIAGDEEARLSFAGATATSGFAKPTVVVDVGGGSTEFVFGSDSVDYAVSLNMGSVRITEDVIASRPATSEELEAARGWLEEKLSALQLPSTPAAVVGVAGTFTALAAIDLKLKTYNRDRVHGHVMPLERIGRIASRLARLSVPQTAEIPSLPASRAEVLLGGALVALASVIATGASEVVISEHDLLDGLLDQVVTRD
jgi:exopolyphosphatase/guanosine-5'-triphosphate,3'-diphosphate pyrophosphatase